jgi:hypothetical protein
MALISNRHSIELSGRCTRPLCFAAPGDEYYGLTMIEVTQYQNPVERVLQLGVQGSCALFSYNGLHFVAFTRHQIYGAMGDSLEELYENLELLYVLLDDGVNGLNHPNRQILLPRMAQDIEDHEDFVVACVESTMLNGFMRSLFFPVARGDIAFAGDDVVCGGYPTHRQVLLMEPNGQRTRLAALRGNVDFRAPYEQGIVNYRVEDEPIDGYSGGAVIVSHISKYGNPLVFIDGIIQRGGNGTARYLGMEYILDRIDGG